MPCQVSQLPGQRKCKHKIFCGDLFLQLFADPFLCLMVLTIGAVTMSTGVWYKGLMTAHLVLALQQHFRTVGRAAGFDGAHRFKVPRQQAVLVFLDKILLVDFKDRGQTDHDMCPQPRLKPSIILFICPSARSEVWVVRCVYRAVEIELNGAP